MAVQPPSRDALVEIRGLAYELNHSTRDSLEHIRLTRARVVPDPLVAFVDVPMTARATVVSMFARAYPEAAVSGAGNYLIKPEGVMTRLSRPRHPEESVLVGQVPYGLFRNYLPSGTRYVTFLREPTDRVIQSYYFHFHRTGTALDERRPVTTDSIDDALEMSLPQLTNLATRLLCGNPAPPPDLPASALDDAKESLSEFAGVGIYERFVESMVLLQQALGLPLTAYEAHHILRGRAHTEVDVPTVDEVSDAQRAQIVECNQLDLELYAFARELFDDAVADADDQFTADVETLRGLSVAVTEAALQSAREWLHRELPPGSTLPLGALQSSAGAAGISNKALARASHLMAITSELNEDGRWIWTRPPTGADVAIQVAGENVPAAAVAGKHPKRQRRARRRDTAQRSATSSRSPDPGASPAAEKRNAREGFLDRARACAPYVGVQVNGARFVVATWDRQMGRHLFLKQSRPEFGVLRRAVNVVEILGGDDVITDRQFVDVGANIGTSTVAALVSHRFGFAVCCEPEEENYRLLCANLALNDLEDRAAPLRLGVSDRIGHSNLVVAGGPAGKSRVVLDRRRIEAKAASRASRSLRDPSFEAPEVTVTDVELVTLDRLVRSGVIDRDRLGMVWIDVEGHEGHVLQGAGTLTDVGVPIVLEFHPAGLNAEGSREATLEIVERCYTHFVDLRRTEAGQERFGLRQVAELRGYAYRFLDRSNTVAYTDLLLLRLDAAQADVADRLPELVRERMRHLGEDT